MRSLSAGAAASTSAFASAVAVSRDYKFKGEGVLRHPVRIDSAASTAAGLKRDVKAAIAAALKPPSGRTYEDLDFLYEDEDGDWCIVHDRSFGHFPAGVIRIKLKLANT